jgi:hypothetical protein
MDGAQRLLKEPAMEITILLEPVDGDGYRATGVRPLDVVVEAPTREEALAKFREQLQARLKNGAELVALEVGTQAHPLARYVGMFKDDPLVQDWKKSMAQYRRRVDKDRDRP